MPQCGLICLFPQKDPEPVSLEKIAISAEFKDLIVVVDAELHYVNPTKDTNYESCEFVFPLDESCAIFRWRATIEDKVIEGEVHPNAKADQIYDDAIKEGNTAFKLKQQHYTSDVFQAQIGNLGPGEKMKMNLQFVQELAPLTNNGVIEYTLPTVLNPRYTPIDSPALKEQLPIKWVAKSDAKYSFDFKAIVNIGKGRIAEIRSATGTQYTEQVTVEYHDTTRKSASVVIDGNSFGMDHDIRLNIKIVPEEGAALPASVLFEDGTKSSDEEKDSWMSKSVAMVTLAPSAVDVVEDTTPAEYVFVVDRSGSMMGDRIENTQSALLIFLKSLPIGCKFNIIGFGSRFECLFPTSQPYNEATLDKAMTYQKHLKADYGGTEMLRPLEHLYDQKIEHGTRRLVFLLTDGQIGNVNDVLSLVKKNSGTTRVFSLGIGEGASSALVKGTARAGRGVYDFVFDTKKIQSAVMRLWAAASKICFESVVLENIPQTALAIPSADLPCLIAGEPLVFYVAFDEATMSDVVSKMSDKNMKVVARRKAGSDEGRVEIGFTTQYMSLLKDDNALLPLHRLAAKRYIRSLTIDEEDYDKRYKNTGLAEKISCSASVVCEHTSFVGVHKKASGGTIDPNEVKNVKVTVGRPTEGYGAPMMFADQLICDMSAPMMRSAVPKMRKAYNAAPRSLPMFGSAAPMAEAMMETCYGSEERAMDYAESEEDECDGAMPSFSSHNVSATESATTFDLEFLARFQKFDGHFSSADADAILSAGCYDRSKLEQMVLSNLPSASGNTDATITVLVSAIFRARWSHTKVEWDGMDQKAMAWLATQTKASKREVENAAEKIATAILQL